MWESLSEFEIHFKIGHASFNVSLSPVSITSDLLTRYPSNCPCKSLVIILRFHSCRLDLKLDQIWTVPFTVARYVLHMVPLLIVRCGQPSF